MQATITDIKGRFLLTTLAVTIAMFLALADTRPAHAASGNFGPYSTYRPAQVSCPYGGLGTEISVYPPDVRPFRSYYSQRVAWRPVVYYWNSNYRQWMKQPLSNYAWHYGTATTFDGPAQRGQWNRIYFHEMPGFYVKIAADIRWQNPRTGAWDGQTLEWFHEYWNGAGGYCDLTNP
jgi:hypothetical protein